MQRTKEQILQDLKTKLVSQFGDEIHDVILFGSFSKNTQTIDSDFDILIILKTSFNWITKNKIRDICYDVSLENDILIDSKIVSATDLETKFWGKHPLFTDAIKLGIHAQ
jgi:uncharacterized protein